jgi:hypothetical protein
MLVAILITTASAYCRIQFQRQRAIDMRPCGTVGWRCMLARQYQFTFFVERHGIVHRLPSYSALVEKHKILSSRRCKVFSDK